MKRKLFQRKTKKPQRQPTIQELENELKTIQKTLQNAVPQMAVVPPVRVVPPTGFEPLYRRQRKILIELRKRKNKSQ